jgi:hypothetical protein
MKGADGRNFLPVYLQLCDKYGYTSEVCFLTSIYCGQKKSFVFWSNYFGTGDFFIFNYFDQKK